MTVWHRLTVAVGLAAFGAARADALPEAPTPRAAADPVPTRGDAEAAERAARWEQAADAYLRLYLAAPTAELRERFRVCLRNAAQQRRHRDPAFQQFAQSLAPSDALNVYAEVVGKLAGQYADRDRATPGKLFALGLDEFDRALGDAGFRDRYLPAADPARVQRFRQQLRGPWRARRPDSAKDARQAARDLVSAARDEAGVRTPSAVLLELICGACAGLDEYTVYVAPSGSHADLAGPIAEFAAYGILVELRGTELVVDGIVPGSWAAVHAALRKGDRVTRLNGRSLAPATPAAVADATREPLGPWHELELAAGEGMAVPVVARLPLPLPTVFAADIVQLKDGVGYVRLAAFRDTTPRELDDAILSLRGRGMRSLVLDVRGNPGGAFPAAVLVAQKFLPAGVVVSTQGQAPDFADRVFTSDAGMAAWDFPVVLLVDARTMSAAEVVAVALKDHNRATLVGLPTFGKGAVQAPVRLQAIDGEGKSGVLVLTVATVFGPRSGPLQGGGVVPNVLEPDPVRQLDQAVSRAAELAGGR